GKRATSGKTRRGARSRLSLCVAPCVGDRDHAGPVVLRRDFQLSASNGRRSAPVISDEAAMTEGGSPTRQDATPGPAETRSAHHADAHSGRLSNLRSHSQAALASVFYLLLADAAFETFR